MIPYKETLLLKDQCKCPYEVNLPERMTHNDFDLEEDIINPVDNFIKKHCLIDTEENNLKNIDEEIKQYKRIPDEIKSYIEANLNK